ncbi:MAG: putative tail fiber protein [Prokaryotic dsDNA virus sp.]|nr:MAG: putative tail fiber protein [Prokaryotic dsDNA virus sp.]|tara:strand:+ start:10643 stop:13993 length:3351 start_codon:yes stop_codon:yes gene_type:complete
MKKDNKIIRGAGGGGNRQPPPPYRAPDTLHSRSFATVHDLISEGEIEGFATPSKAGITNRNSTEYANASLKDVFLDDTPILNATASNTSPLDTDFNFQDVTFKRRFGTNNQPALSGIPSESRSPSSVGVIVTASTPVTRQVTNTDVDAIIVTLTWSQIQILEDDGDIRGDTVEYKIQVQYNSGGFTDVVTNSVTGRTADAYARDHRINVTGAFPVDVRVVRITADSTSSTVFNEFEFTSLQEVVDDANTYPDSAYMALRLDSKQFNRIPTRKYRIRGIKVRIPGAGASNTGTPTVDMATGRIQYPQNYVFNGVMGAATYTNCPAMCLLDLLTNERYGFGDHLSDSNLDLFSFVAASKHANELVDDGTGAGTKEARFSCNVNIQSPRDAFDAINDLASVMRCMPIWSAGTITISQDKLTNPSYLFNLSNVDEAGFSYSGSSLKQRHTVVSVSYFNMDSLEVDYEVVEDQAAINKFGTIVKQVNAFACTSRNQAARLGRAILFAEQNESEVISFNTSIDAGIVVRPGMVIEVADPVRAGVRRGGKIVSATTTAVTIDAASSTSLPALTDTPTLSVMLPDGSFESRTITNINGAVITVNPALSIAPNAESPYLVSSTTLQSQLFRVIEVEEKDRTIYSVSALSYVAGKYAFIENNTPLPERTVSLLNRPAEPPSNLTITEQTIVINNIARSKLIVDWRPVEGVTQYLVQYKFENNNYVAVVVFSSDFELLDTPVGDYVFEVFSYNAALEISANSTSKTFTAVGKTTVPENVSNLTIEPVNKQFIRLRFDQATAIDVLHGGRVYIRHSNLPENTATFQASQDIIAAISGNATEAICPALAGTYLVKFQDDGGRFSTNEAKISLTTVEIQDAITVKQDNEHTDSPPFNNNNSSLFSNTQFSVSKGGLVLTNPVTNQTGTYNFKDTLDLGGVFSLSITRFFQGVGFYTGDLFDNRTDLIDTWTDFDGAVANDANAKLQVRTSTDMSNYGSFNDVANGTFKGRGFQFRVVLETKDTAQNINLQQLGYVATLDSRTEQSAVISSGGGAKNVTFANPFFVGTSALGNLNDFKPAVSINPQNMGTGEFFEVSNISATGFTVHFKNSSNGSISKNFTFTAVGFGKGG